MGVIKQGIQGGFSGKVGPHVGSSWKGINVMRAMPTSVANPNTEAQQEQRSAFKQVSVLASSLLTSVIKPFWDKQAVRMSGYNLFVKTNISSASKDAGFNFPELKMSLGRMDAPTILSTSVHSSNRVVVAWDNIERPMYSADTDRPYFIILDDNGKVVYSKQDGNPRTYDEIETPFDLELLDDTYHVYMFFVSEDGKTISKSTYKKAIRE